MRNKFRSAKPDYVLLIISLLLFAIGITTLLSASAPKALAEYGNSYYFLKNQVTYAFVGILFGLVIYFIDYRVFNNKKFLIIAFLGLLLVTLSVKILGTETKGAIRWIRIGKFSVQPSEFVKVGILFITAGLYSELAKQKELNSFSKSIILPATLVAIVAGTTFVTQNHLSAAVLMFIAFMAQMLIAGVDLKKIAIFIVLSATIAGIGFFVIKEKQAGGFRMNRVEVWQNPFEYVKTSGWQTVQSLYAIGSGGILGAGIGESKQKQSYIPEPQNDFIFSIFAEEMGFLGVVFVMILFFLLISRGILIARNIPDLFGKILAIGIITMLGSQIVLNLAVVSNTIPVTGISLPFFSYGGSAIIAIIIQIAILLNISKMANKIKLQNLAKKEKNEDISNSSRNSRTY